ncbi:(d)CMP kinase [Motilibacter deserti]|uniref:Cytidylate kinase n=1 Tax=Motilibacter deserti TaxID=2714956 RepID=A0ABX0GVU3_9ACTN|nr:(d)CMP kinase [Motilibacter deserti]NHC14256.1 (d)CMP kinase [Motilibacter deserti]
MPATSSLDRIVIAIDGPSGSGKSTVSRRVAARLGLGYLDTGATYRAVAWAALDRGLDLEDGAALTALATSAVIEQSPDPTQDSVRIDGADVTQAIREQRISAVVSKVAGNLDVRKELVRRQQEVAARGRVVIEGRDITTVVAPDAPVRILLTADERARLERRARELHGTTDDAAIAATHDSIVRRDADDSKVASFLTAAEGVVEVDTSALGLDEVVAEVLRVVAERVPAAADLLERTP